MERKYRIELYVHNPKTKSIFTAISANIEGVKLIDSSVLSKEVANIQIEDSIVDEIERNHSLALSARYSASRLNIIRSTKRFIKVGGKYWQVPVRKRKKNIRQLLQRWIHYFKQSDAEIIGIWCPMKPKRDVIFAAAKLANKSLLCLEDAAIPGNIVCDYLGVNAGNQLARNIEFYKNYFSSRNDSPQSIDINSVFKNIPQRSTSNNRYQNLNSRSEDQSVKTIYCPLQVPGDTQIYVYGDWINSIEQFIDIVYEASQHLPENWRVVVREHPSSPRSFAKKLKSLSNEKFQASNVGTSTEMLDQCDAVITVNSSVGLHTFLCDKPVICLGEAFWGFSPLATPVKNIDQLRDSFKAIESITYSKSCRNMFLSYLFSEYFIPIRMGKDKATIDTSGIEIIHKQIQSSLSHYQKNKIHPPY